MVRLQCSARLDVRQKALETLGRSPNLGHWLVKLSVWAVRPASGAYPRGARP